MRRNKEGFLGFSIAGFFIFLLTIGFTSTCAIFAYHLSDKYSNGNTAVVVLVVVTILIIGAIMCSAADVLRRKMMVERPVKIILNATKKMASGDFNINILHNHDYLKYDEYDLIFDNINTLARELSKNEMLKNDFISNVSHEIKTPLAVIQNYATVLQSDDLTDEKKEQYLNGLIIQTKKLSNLVSNILKLNKLENQQIIPEIEEFDLSELLRVIILSYESLFEKKQLQLECNIDDVKIVSSSSLLEIVFNNLISNAIKFTNNGGKVVVNLKQDKTHIFIDIEDAGCGISQEVGKHIFDKFYQGDKSHNSEGNGLGLALVKNVIDLIGGEISVKSKVGVGTTFTIILKKG